MLRKGLCLRRISRCLSPIGSWPHHVSYRHFLQALTRLGHAVISTNTNTNACQSTKLIVSEGDRQDALPRPATAIRRRCSHPKRLLDCFPPDQPASVEDDFAALSERQWNTFNELFTDINLAATKAGFAVAKRRHGNRGPAGQYRLYDLICIVAKDEHKEVDTAKESRSVKKYCLWKAKAVFLVAFNAWKFVVMHGTHSYPLDPKGAGYIAGYRRRERTAAVIEAILKYLTSTKNNSAHIVRMIKKDLQGINIKPRDVFHGNKVAKAGLLTPTQQFIHHLTLTPSIYCNICRQNDVADGRIERIFWAYNWCIEQWNQNPELMIIDCTYKVNKFDMPLLQVLGVTCMHGTLTLGYCLVSGEKEVTIRWVLEFLNSLIQLHNEDDPARVVNNRNRYVL
jgi:hypothetical protein